MKNYRVSMIFVMAILLLFAIVSIAAQDNKGDAKITEQASSCQVVKADASCCPGQAKAQDANSCPGAIPIEECTPEQRAECMKVCDSKDTNCKPVE